MTSSARDPFAFLATVQALQAPLRAFKLALQRNDLYLQLSEQAASGAPLAVRRLATFSRDRGGQWRFKRIYLSYQAAGALPRAGFRGHTFFFSPKQGELLECPFPDDPSLSAAGRTVARLEQAGLAGAIPVEVLRYVPMRRLTLRGAWDETARAPSIVKVVENAGTGRIAARLRAVWDSSRGPCVSFAVPALHHHDSADAVLVQECLPGAPLIEQIRPDNYLEILRRAGTVHAEVHALAVPAEACGDTSDPFPTVLERIEWLAFVRPGRAEVFHGARARLEASRPAVDDAPRVFCHGDFRCTQILADADRWSVIDFDESGYADPHQDVARFIAFLKYDVPLFGTPAQAEASNLLARGEAAYLEGYSEASRSRLDPDRLLWHRTCQEILHLAQLVRRDLTEEATFDQGCERIARLVEGLATRTGAGLHPGVD